MNHFVETVSKDAFILYIHDFRILSLIPFSNTSTFLVSLYSLDLFFSPTLAVDLIENTYLRIIVVIFVHKWWNANERDHFLGSLVLFDWYAEASAIVVMVLSKLYTQPWFSMLYIPEAAHVFSTQLVFIKWKFHHETGRNREESHST